MRFAHTLSSWRGRCAVFLAGVGVLTGPSSVMAHCGCCGRGEKGKEPLLMRIGLTPKQATQLLPIFEKAMLLRAEHYLQIAELTPKMLETYARFRAEDALGQGFSKEVRGDTARLHVQEIRLGDQFGRDILKLEAQVEAILTERQLKALTPSQRDRPGSNPRAIIGHVAGGNMAALGAAIDPEVADAARKMREIDQYRHPRATQLGRQLLDPKVSEQIYFLAHAKPSEEVFDALRTIKNGTRRFPRRQHDELNKQLGPIRGEISAWNLVNGLHLGKEQAVTIARCAQQASILREQFRHGPLGPRAKPPQKLAAKMAVAPAVVENLYQLERMVVDTLSNTQVQVIRDFKPCLLPPKNLENPVQVGQANDNSALTAFLKKARTLPPSRHPTAVDRWLAGEEKHCGKYDDDYRAHRRQVLLTTLDQAGEMNDADFAASLNDLADRARPVDVRTELRYKIDGIFSDRHIPGVIAKAMLFDKHMVRVLTIRAEQLSRPIKVVKRDLSKSPRAEHTDKSTTLGEP